MAKGEVKVQGSAKLLVQTWGNRKALRLAGPLQTWSREMTWSERRAWERPTLWVKGLGWGWLPVLSEAP